MTNKLVVIINSLKVPKIKKILLHEVKFLLPNYSCLQNPWLVGLQPPDPRSLCPQWDLLNPPLQTKFLRYATTGNINTNCTFTNFYSPISPSISILLLLLLVARQPRIQQLKSTATCSYTLPNPVLYYVTAIRYASSSYTYRPIRPIKTEGCLFMLLPLFWN